MVSTLPAEVREERIYNGGPPSCWGLGWRVNHPGARHIINIILTQRIAPCSGTPDLLSLHCSVCYAGTELKFGEANAGQIYGHHGAVGAMIWCDPVSGVSMSVATPEPDMCYSDEFNLLSDR